MQRQTPLIMLMLHLVVKAVSKNSEDSSATKVVVDGDLMLGGLFPIHSSAEMSDSPCGRMNSQRGIQRMEAMIFTLRQVNRNPRVLRYGQHKIRLGGLLFDTCSKDTHALEKALEFVKNSLTHEYDATFVCEHPNGSVTPAIRSADLNHLARRPIRGVVGGAYSQVSVQVANLLRLFAIPQISYASTSAALSDKSRFEFFARTVPPDTEQAKALADIVSHFNWTYVSTVFSKGDYGEGGIQSFESEIDKMDAGVCIAERLLINLEPSKQELDDTVERLYRQRRARVVVMFTREDHTEKFLDAVRRANVTRHFVWISADGWGKSPKPVRNNSWVAAGALTLEISTSDIPHFNRYFTDLLLRRPRLLSNSTFTNPFFEEYWQQKFNCQQGKSCSVSQSALSKAVTEFEQEPKVQFVHDAVYAFAYALDRAVHLVCATQPPQADTRTSGLLDSCVANLTSFSGRKLFNLIINSDFTNSASRRVQFTSNGDGIGTYTIYNYRRSEGSQFDYRPVGLWRKNSGLEWREDQLIEWVGEAEQPTSRCSEECGVGQKKMYSNKGVSKDKCCWSCGDCQPHQRVSDTGDSCVDCSPDEGPTADRMKCVPLRIQYMQWSSWYAIVPIVLSTFGICCTTFVMVTFFRYNETPLVKASGRELSYLLLTGCLLCYVMTFLLIMKPRIVTCALQRIGIGLGFAVIYSSLLTKTNRIARIFEAASRSAKRPPFISPKSQLLISGALISVQLVCTALWLLLNQPGVRIYHPQRLEAILRCKIDDKSFLVSLLYNMILIMVCTYYAIKTRRIPENFNESKFIGFTMYTTCIIWLAFVPLYFGTHSSFEVQITTLCISISLSATVALACLFTPKLYIIFFQPEKNVRKLTMNSNHYKKHPSSSAGSYTNHRDASLEGDSSTTTRLPSQLYRSDDNSVADRTFANRNASAAEVSCEESDGIVEQFDLKAAPPLGSPFNRRGPSPILQAYRLSRTSSESDSGGNFRYEDGFV